MRVQTLHSKEQHGDKAMDDIKVVRDCIANAIETEDTRYLVRALLSADRVDKYLKRIEYAE